MDEMDVGSDETAECNRDLHFALAGIRKTALGLVLSEPICVDIADAVENIIRML
jgi:hypothetical protein